MSNNFFSAIKKIPGLNKNPSERTNQFPNENKEYSTEIYSEKINAKYRTIFLDLKEGVKGKFIKISEKNKQGKRNTVMVDKMDLDNFIDALQRLSTHLKTMEDALENDDNLGNYDEGFNRQFSSQEEAMDELSQARNAIDTNNEYDDVEDATQNVSENAHSDLDENLNNQENEANSVINEQSQSSLEVDTKNDSENKFNV